MSFTVLDIIFTVLIGLFIVRCYLKGFVTELLSMAGIALGLLAALFFHKNGADFLRDRFWPDLRVIPEILAFIALFVIIFILIKFLCLMIKGIIEGIKLGGLDRSLGLIFGFAEGIVVVSLFLFIIRIQPIFNPAPLLADSFFAQLLLPLIVGPENVIPFIPAQIPAEADLGV